MLTVVKPVVAPPVVVPPPPPPPQAESINSDNGSINATKEIILRTIFAIFITIPPDLA